MTDLIRDMILSCTMCQLHLGRTRAVPGEGPAPCALMLIGEAPGQHEDMQGRPFVGPAGHVLDTLLASAGLTRSDVYITNVVKCRPPANRQPLPIEVMTCRFYLENQIDAVRPAMIVAMGSPALSWFFPHKRISDSHGIPMQWHNTIVYPTYHPAAVLHRASLKPAIERDFAKIPTVMPRHPAARLCSDMRGRIDSLNAMLAMVDEADSVGANVFSQVLSEWMYMETQLYNILRYPICYKGGCVDDDVAWCSVCARKQRQKRP